MNVMELLYRRPAVRAYAPREVDGEVLQALLDAAVQAPSATDRQPWVFAIVQAPEQLRVYSERAKETVLAEKAGEAGARYFQEPFGSPSFDIFRGAATLVVIGVGEELPYPECDCWLAAANLILAAREIGIAASLVSLALPVLNAPDVKADLGFPAGGRVVAAIVLGYPAVEAGPTQRRAPRIASWRKGPAGANALRDARDRSGLVSADAGQGSRSPWLDLEVHKIELEMQNEELRSARAELESAVVRRTELFEFAPIGFVVLDSDTALGEINLAGAQLLGADRRRLLGRRLLTFVNAHDQQVVSGLMGRVIMHPVGDRSSESCEARVHADNGARRDIRLTATALTPSPRQVLVALEDVTARRHAEAALRQESHRKDAFLAALSHELRNPLTPIRTSLQILERVEPGGEQARKSLASITRQVDHLSQIVGQLLDVTRIAHGKIHLEKTRQDLAGLVQRSLDDYKDDYQARGIALQGRIADEKIGVDVDATRFVQILSNLLGTALKFTPRGGHVVVSTRREGSHAVLSVCDDGAGIAADGLGLGLATVKGLVELHGGSAQVASKGLGLGAEFTVRLPLVGAPLSALAPPPSPGVRGRRVLVIDDSTDVREAMRDLLELDGHEVQVASSGPEGIAVVKAFRPEVVLCDIGLPGMSGYEVARAMRADPDLEGVRLVALSGYAREADRQRSLEAGFDEHLAKPPSDRDLQRALGAEGPAPGRP